MLSSGGMEPWVGEASLETAMPCHAVPCHARSTRYVLYITTDALFSPRPPLFLLQTLPPMLVGFALHFTVLLNDIFLYVFFTLFFSPYLECQILSATVGLGRMWTAMTNGITARFFSPARNECHTFCWMVFPGINAAFYEHESCTLSAAFNCMSWSLSANKKSKKKQKSN